MNCLYKFREKERRASSATTKGVDCDFRNHSYKRAYAIRPYYSTIFPFNYLTILPLRPLREKREGCRAFLLELQI